MQRSETEKESLIVSIMNVVVPVAGLGTRLMPLTKSLPKEMLPVGRRPVLHHIVEELERNGLRRVLFVTGPGKGAIEHYFSPDPALVRHLREAGKEEQLAELTYEHTSPEFFYVHQKYQAGLGDAIRHAEGFIGREPFAVALGDSLLAGGRPSQTLSLMTRLFEEQGCAAVIAFEEVPQSEVHRYGIADPAGGLSPGLPFALKGIIEKPDPAEAPSRLAVAARYVFSPAIFDALRSTTPGKGGEIQLTDAIASLIARGERVMGVPLPAGERRYDIGSFASYYEAFVQFALADPQCGEAFRQRLLEKLK